MHEAALAETIAIRWREARRAGTVGRPRLVVRGGHDEPLDFDAALRLHLAIAAPELDGDTLEIIHAPVARLCSGCGGEFLAASQAAPCPDCGSAALPGATGDSIELHWPDEVPNRPH
jgi:Zn finger protein HypA/HybF involved in hydrogenase expression